MRRLGFHVSAAGGLENVIPRALARHCNTVQLFLSPPAQWEQREIGVEEAERFREAMRRKDILPYFVHAVYLLNLASTKKTNWKRSVAHLTSTLRKAELVGAAGVIIHLGSVGEGGDRREGVQRVARALKQVREESESGVEIILENSAGAGNTLGADFEEIARIREAAETAEPLGLCLDTAHAWVAGWPLDTEEGLEETAAAMRKAGEEEKLRVVHCNEALGARGSHRDRHWHLGEGEIGKEGMRRILNFERWRKLPYIMETPGTEEDDRRNMYWARRGIAKEERPPLRRRPGRVP